MNNATSPETVQIKVRISIHLGDVVHRGGDIYGMAMVSISLQESTLLQTQMESLFLKMYADKLSTKLVIALETTNHKDDIPATLRKAATKIRNGLEDESNKLRNKYRRELVVYGHHHKNYQGT